MKKQFIRDGSDGVFVTDGRGLLYKLGLPHANPKRIGDTQFHYIVFDNPTKDRRHPAHDGSGDLDNILVLRAGNPGKGLVGTSISLNHYI